jgi:hypothetical protein
MIPVPLGKGEKTEPKETFSKWDPLSCLPPLYTLEAWLVRQNQWLSCRFKDAFWACPLMEDSRDIFAFEWEDPQKGRKQQYRWTVLPQVFTKSLNLFGQILEHVLEEFALPS